MSEGRAPYQRYTIALLAAVAAHAAVLFGVISEAPYTPLEFGVEAGVQGVEVDLVAALPAAETPAPLEPAVEEAILPEPPDPAISEPTIPEPKPPEPEPEPQPTVAPKAPAPIPSPPPATPSPSRSTPSGSKPETQARPRTAKPSGASGDGSSSNPGQDATTARASLGALSAQPGYLRNPHPAYPEEARKAGQAGVVLLHVKLDDRGRVISVTVSRSSGYPLLDERARSTVQKRWAFRPARMGKQAVASEVTIPIRFTLD